MTPYDESQVLQFDTAFTGTPLANFDPASNDEIKNIILNAPVKSCELDPLPTYILRQCLDPLLPLITAIVNESLTQACFPSAFKKAIVRPLLKKANLNQEVLKKNRPVSNLPFISKIVEKVVSRRIEEHLKVNRQDDIFQSAYRVHHSVETALIKVNHDIISSLDNKQSIALVLLDLSAAFDVIDHTLLAKRLETSCGIVDDALSWVISYLSDRKQCVAVGGKLSEPMELLCGVPQGSVLGPRLYCLYSRPIGEVCHQHDVRYHCYADDTQIYVDVKEDWQLKIEKLEKCVEDISRWMKINKLMLNTGKTEFIIFSPKNMKHTVPAISLKVGQESVLPSPSVRNLGVQFDSCLTMEKHINSTVSSCYFQIRNIGFIRQYITKDVARTLVQALVLSRLDFGNSLLSGVPKYLLDKLQRVQNTATRLVMRAPIQSRVTPLLLSLNWLPVDLRIEYKVLVFIYKALSETSPAYLQDLISTYTPARTLRSAQENRLVVPRYEGATYGGRRFDVVAANLWNAIPVLTRQAPSLSSFKSQVKRHLRLKLNARL